MKKILLFMLSITVVLSACKKEYEEIGVPSSKFEGATADWGLTSFKVVDKAAIVEESMDMTDYFGSNVIKPNIRFYTEGADTLYSCDTTGLPMNIFESVNGKWRFDDNNFPTKIILMPTGSINQIEFKLMAPIRVVDQKLILRKSIICKDKEVAAYDLEFIRRIN